MSFPLFVLSLLLLASRARAEGCQLIEGNWYCRETNHTHYSGFHGSGAYNDVVSMPDNGRCGFESRPYRGRLAPLDEDLSIHVRGPCHLTDVAVYTLLKEEPKPKSHQRRKRAQDWVTATIDGKVVSWRNNYHGGAEATRLPKVPPITSPRTGTQQPPPPPHHAAHARPPSRPHRVGPNHASVSPPPAVPNDNADAACEPGNWERIAYYNASHQKVHNMRFLGNYGGQASGVFDNTYGNSLSYLKADASGGAAAPETLRDAIIPSNKEFAIFSAEKCDKASCGFSRTRDVAYSSSPPSLPSPVKTNSARKEGFGGADKIFLFRFSMPLDNNRGFNGDMPAIWLLNGRIPRTVQYGKCSCWTSKCGEVDLFEALHAGSDKCKSTFHIKNGGGSSDWFKRPVDRYITLAAIFHHETASVVIKILPDHVPFAESLDDKTVRHWIRRHPDQTHFDFNNPY
ncbi:hypothetical protein L249_0284 [Ophiocordyceps polyrhachis-furcata BCC 54312]|uniref:glucan endo-1,3-beta-D-glucosidase n=1 Tax=Ophiocordyceps polyrhachis-furcata BCC 54312 TaxID=1330021 RepID=A0A367LFM2_9HYPO|nr:hypothetical protein L249_0284 [Ophiocordyceps polyrhachis-furcata BCC 54312]